METVGTSSEANCDGNCANYTQERIINVKCNYSHSQCSPGLAIIYIFLITYSTLYLKLKARSYV